MDILGVNLRFPEQLVHALQYFQPTGSKAEGGQAQFGYDILRTGSKKKNPAKQKGSPDERADPFDNKYVELKDRIAVDPEILVGKPVIAGTRVSVEFIIDLLASGWTHEQILANYPRLTDSDILACLQYVRDLLHSERVYPLSIG